MKHRASAPLILVSAVVVACTPAQVRSTAPVPVDSSAALAVDTARGRESGSGGYVIPAPLDPRKHGPRRFYTDKRYGSEREFNPLTQLLNEGFDVLSSTSQNRHIFDRGLDVDARNVLRSLANPIGSINEYGWGNLLRAEILPTSFTRSRTSGKWISNYQLHLLGSGMVSLRMTDWYEIHGYRNA